MITKNILETEANKKSCLLIFLFYFKQKYCDLHTKVHINN